MKQEILKELFVSIEGIESLLGIYEQLNKEISIFNEKTGLVCPEKCGKCCITSAKKYWSFSFWDDASCNWTLGKGWGRKLHWKVWKIRSRINMLHIVRSGRRYWKRQVRNVQLQGTGMQAVRIFRFPWQIWQNQIFNMCKDKKWNAWQTCQDTEYDR